MPRKVSRRNVRSRETREARELEEDALDLSTNPIIHHRRHRQISQRAIRARLTQQSVHVVRISMNPSDDEAEEDENGDEQGNRALDNPPRRSGLGRTTIGFELELLLAVCRQTSGPDPHPGEARWLCHHLVDVKKESTDFQYTVCNRIVDELRRRGVATRKSDNGCAWVGVSRSLPFALFMFYTLHPSTLNRGILTSLLVTGPDEKSSFEWWNSLEYELPNGNDHLINSWTGEYTWDESRTNDDNTQRAVVTLFKQFIQYHAKHKLQVHLTRYAAIQNIRDNVIKYCVLGVVPPRQRERVATLWYERMWSYVYERKKRHYSISRYERDANCVAGSGASDQYRAWSVRDDFTITTFGMPRGRDYYHPCASPGTRQPGPELYKWWSPEVISPVLDYDNPQTYESLRTVCSTLRDAFRIHKPMAQVECGVHIHLGQENGWTLVQMKRFATLWHYVEDSLYYLHSRWRRDSQWVSPLASSSLLAYEVMKKYQLKSSVRATTPEPTRSIYAAQMAQHVPLIRDRDQHEFIHNIWQFSLLSELNKAMQSPVGHGSVRWRISGRRLSPRPNMSSIETLEFRMLQGTLDAEHIWRWASICERLVRFARDSSAAAFRKALQDLMSGDKLDALGLDPDDMRWFTSRQAHDGYFEYPDRNRVDWSRAFMVPGDGDTHGISDDNLPE